MTNSRFPMKYKGLFIHEYEVKQEKIKGYVIGISFSEVYIDEDEACNYNLPTSKYQEILKSCGAKQYKHQFIYNDNDVKVI